MERKEIPMPPLPEEEVEEVTPKKEHEVEEVTPEKQPEFEQITPEKQPETPQQINFKALRAEKERLEREKEEALLKLKEYEKSKKIPDEEEDLEINISDDDLFEGRHYKKLQKQLKKQEEILKQYQSQVQLTSTEAKLKAQYADFDKVVNEATISRLREEEPEIADAIASTSNMYSKAVSAYKMIKKLGIYVEDTYQQDKAIVRQNSLKPKTSASVSPQQGDTPLTKANSFADGLTPELKKQLWREMNDASKLY